MEFAELDEEDNSQQQYVITEESFERLCRTTGIFSEVAQNNFLERTVTNGIVSDLEELLSCWSILVYPKLKSMYCSRIIPESENQTVMKV